MRRRRRRPTLPGVADHKGVQASRSYDGRDAIKRARRVANIRDAADIAILLVVDWIFFKFPTTRVPMLTRDQTVILLVLVHLAFAIYIIAARVIPAWRARSIAATWSEAEKQKVARKK